MYVLGTREGPAVSGWVQLRWLQELKFQKEKKKTQIVEHVCQINETNHSICVTGCDKGMQCSSVAAHSLELAEDVGVLG